MESASIPAESPSAAPTGEFATKAEVDALATRVDALEQKGTQVPGGAPEPTNPGENLERTETNPELDPHQPGVEPEAGETPAPPVEEPPAPTPTPIPAQEASEMPLYVDVTADRSATWEYTPPFTPAGLVTPDGRLLYHYQGDTAGEPGTGAKDGMIGIYADDVVVPAPANSGENDTGNTPAEGASA